MPTVQKTLIRVGHSPDPDDAFMFHALANGKIDTGPYEFTHQLQDIQTLNQRAMKSELEITAISIHAYPYVADKYALTSCGSSMGDKYGPMVVARQPMSLSDLRGKTIAIPGKLTTAFLALQLALGRGQDAAQSSVLSPHHSFLFHVVPFDQILQHVRDGKADAGLIIHEGQLTYATSGLHLIVDLGEWWHEKTSLPLPLGGNCIRRDLGQPAMGDICTVLLRSIEYALEHRDAAVDYAMNYARDMGKALADRFVGMYVIKWSLDYGLRGRDAVEAFLREAIDAGLVPD
jgi:1,4-dihydroxy-6-naphthoate synthase